jgi:hypothetical protein
VVLATTLATLGVLLLARLSPPGAEAQGITGPWRLTVDARSRLAGWSPDGRTVLVNRWGPVIGDGPTRQTLSELWSVDVTGEAPVKLAGNAVQPAYSPDATRLAYLSFAGDGRWEARVLDLPSGEEETWSEADWRVPPAWLDAKLTYGRAGRVWRHGEKAEALTADLPVLPPGALVRLSPSGTRLAWSDGAGLWAVALRDAPSQALVAGGQMLDFAWSPDGRRLAYVVANEDLSPALWVVAADGENAPIRLAQGRAEMWSRPSWSPDGRYLAFSRAPLGAETASASDIWLVNAEGGDLRPLLRNDLEESGPIWSPDGRYLAFNRAGDVWVLDVTHFVGDPRPQEGLGERSPLIAVSLPPLGEKVREWGQGLARAQASLQQKTPPATIRVIHREENYHRSDVPPGQIDVIPFETYVKRAVPVEVYVSWSMEALKTQAVAARTYAWYYTLVHAGSEWDVSDWVDYQAMGREDQRHPRSDAATDDTQGQYVAYRGEVIKAFYSAENGCPTVGLDGYDYIQAVDDPVSFGQDRMGHGWGMSQWGASRWADWHGWGYQQILAHYYTGVTVELPSTGGPLPLGGVTLPCSNFFVTGNRVYVVANASDEASDVRALGFYAHTDTSTLLVTDTVGSDGWSTVWDVSGLEDTTSKPIALSLRVVDGDANVQQETQPVHIGIDRQPPAETSAVIGDGYTGEITVTLSSLSATDPTPGSGVQYMAFSNQGWAWEGEELYHQSGEEVLDEEALNGRAWRGLAGVHGAGSWYGPYTHDLPPGYAYRAYFRLKTGDATTTAEIATLDVVDEGGTRLLGLRRLRGTDFRAPGLYQEFPVDFEYTDAGAAGLEFRTAFHATADLYLDRVLVLGYPVDLAPSAQWRLTPGEGLKTVLVKFIDGAGNVSADLTTTVMLDAGPPAGWHDFTPEWWDGGNPPTCAVRVFDALSGLNVDSARYRYSSDGSASWSDWLAAECTGIGGTTEVQTVTASNVPFVRPSSMANRIQFRIADMVGLTSTAVYTVPSRSPVIIAGPRVGGVGMPYTFTATVSPLTEIVLEPVTYTWQATEQTSVVHRGGLSDTISFTWTVLGPKEISVTAVEQGREIGSDAYIIAIQARVYLPLVVKD